MQMDRRARTIRDGGCHREVGVPRRRFPLPLVGDSPDGYPGLGAGAPPAAAVLGEIRTLESIPADWKSWGVNASSPPPWPPRCCRIDRALFRDLATYARNIDLFDAVDDLRWRPTPWVQSLATRLDAAVSS